MIPLRDSNPSSTRPFVTWALLGLNVAVYVWTSLVPPWFATGFAMIPTRVVADPWGETFTVFTSMFLHAGPSHLIGNMIFLHIFGDNVEDAMGHGRYAAFFGASGLAAGLAQLASGPASPIPMVGASGAIAGVTGAYVLLYPRAPITVLNPIFPLWLLMGPVFVLPAWIVVAEFFIMNVYMAFQSLGAQSSGGVAVFAHLGGFFAGIALVRPIVARSGWKRRRERRRRPPPGWGDGPGGGGSGWPGHRRGPGSSFYD